MFTKQLARRLQSQGCEKVIVNCIHPGIVRTDLLMNEWYVKVRGTIAFCFILKSYLGTRAKKHSQGIIVVEINWDVMRAIIVL